MGPTQKGAETWGTQSDTHPADPEERPGWRVHHSRRGGAAWWPSLPPPGVLRLRVFGEGRFYAVKMVCTRAHDLLQGHFVAARTDGGHPHAHPWVAIVTCRGQGNRCSTSDGYVSELLSSPPVPPDAQPEADVARAASQSRSS